MKKILLIACILATSFAANAQSTSTKTKKEPTRHYIAKKSLTKIDTSATQPDVYYLAVKKSDIEMALGSARAGFTSWLHTTPTAMNEEGKANQVFITWYNNIAQQVIDQNKLFSDSVAALKLQGKLKADTAKKH